MFDTHTEYEVVIFSIGDTKAGTKMGKLQLKNLNDETLLNCVLWEEALGRMDSAMFRTGNVLRIVSATYNEKYNNCLVSEFELIRESKLGLNEFQTQEALNKIKNYILKIKNEELKTFVSNLLSKYEADFICVPAAKLMHHNYKGGLLQHTSECLDIASKLIEMFSEKIDTDEIYAAAILHDFGKIFEYKMDYETGLIDYNDEFKKDWVSHSQWGFTQCMAKGFKNVAKMIATHHSRIDWGAIVDLGEKDLEPHLYLLHHIDDLSAKYGKISVKDL